MSIDSIFGRRSDGRCGATLRSARTRQFSRLMEMAAFLGADVPFFLLGGRALGINKGEEIYPLPDIPKLHVLVVSPKQIHVPTPDAYRWLKAAYELKGGRKDPELAAQVALVAKEKKDPTLALQALRDVPAGFAETLRQEAVPFLLLSWIGLWGSGSRTALITGVITLIFLVWHSGHDARTTVSARRLLPLVTVSALVTLLAVVSSIGSPAVGSLRRLHDSLPGVSARSVSAFLSEMWNRNGYGAASLLMIEQHPIVGTGPGSFFFLVPDYSLMTGSAPLPPDNAQNWYRHQLAEFGVLGSIGWIAWVVTFGWFVVTARAGRAADRLTIAGLRGILVALAIISLVGMPAWNPAVTLTFWTMAFWLTAVASPGPTDRTHGAAIGAAKWVGIGAVLLVFLGGTAYAARRDLRVANRAAEHGWRYSYGFYDPERAADGSQFRWAEQHARRRAATQRRVPRRGRAGPDESASRGRRHPLAPARLPTSCGSSASSGHARS